MTWWLRYARSQAAAGYYWLAATVGYWIRPYDMLADRRRWRWQPAQRCNVIEPTPALLAAIDSLNRRGGDDD